MNDLLLGTDGDLRIANADMVIGYSNQQHKEHLLVTAPATLIEDESVGIDIENYLNGDDIEGMTAKINEQYTKDGMTVTKINYNKETGDLTDDADYNN